MSEEASGIARRLGQKHLYPPRCPLVHIVGEENAARGAVTPTLARATLTRDSRRRWENARIARRQARQKRGGYFGLAKAIMHAR